VRVYFQPGEIDGISSGDGGDLGVQRSNLYVAVPKVGRTPPGQGSGALVVRARGSWFQTVGGEVRHDTLQIARNRGMGIGLLELLPQVGLVQEGSRRGTPPMLVGVGAPVITWGDTKEIIAVIEYAAARRS
jgi:hypothetical protein